MSQAEKLNLLIKSKRSVFTSADLEKIWRMKPSSVKITAQRMTKAKLLKRIAKGFYAINEDYNIYELANKIISPSYVSLNSALFYLFVFFQKSNLISSVSLLSYEKKIGDLVFKYYSQKPSLFFNLEGINYRDLLSLATAERAVLDCFYFNVLPTIDNADKINFSYLQKLSSLYPQTVQKKAEKLIKAYLK